MIVLILWNLVSPSFRVRDYISGHKSSLLSPAGILLTFSLFFSLSFHIAILGFLGHFNIFLVPLPLVVLASFILTTKSCVDKDFRSVPIPQRITYSLLAAIFPISSPKPAKRTGADGVSVPVVEEKDSSSELMLLHLLHLSNWIVLAAVYIVLMQVSSSFVDAMGNVEAASGLDSTWIVFVGSPVSCILSIGFRLLYNKVQPWSIVSGASKRSCCSCCPPTMKSSYTEIPMQEIKREESESGNPTGREAEEIPVEKNENLEAVNAEFGDVLRYLKEKRKK